MYYPLLRARQFELIALRELAEEQAIQGFIVPILEPVKETHNNLILAHDVFKKYAQKAFLILNPNEGLLKGNENWYNKFFTQFENNSFIPAFHYESKSNLKVNFQSLDFFDASAVLSQNSNISLEDFQELTKFFKISSIIIRPPVRNRELKQYIKLNNINLIRLDDLFMKKARNSDYLEIQEHLFSEEHLFYKEDGFDGFSDYTTLPSEFIDGGSTPRAVVIHLTYLNDKNQIMIRHFTSETNDTVSNVQGKFAEALKKTITFCEDYNLENSAIEELKFYYKKSHYPGLGTVKKISIKNHLLVVSKFLKENQNQ